VSAASRPSGTSIVEVLVALLLGLFVVHLGLTTVLRLRRFQERAERRHDVLVATRISRTVLRGELARGEAGVDWIVGRDSAAVRAFRGTGVVCLRGEGPDELVVAYRGDRLPAPVKDSVEVTTSGGGRVVLDLLSSEPAAGPCPGVASGETPVRWLLGGTVPPDAVLGRVFESGSYHFANAALRYRIGAGGRQPVTPSVWRDAGTGMSVGDSAVVLKLEPRAGWGPSRSGFLVWGGA
jgi:hypothetical protein